MLLLIPAALLRRCVLLRLLLLCIAIDVVVVIRLSIAEETVVVECGGRRMGCHGCLLLLQAIHGRGVMVSCLLLLLGMRR